jgi:carboxylesterase
MTQIIPSAEPFFFPGGATGCLLIHGFTGTPKEMHPMGEYLHQQGYSVLGIRLTGHATRPDDMQNATWQDWLADIEDGWHTLKGTSDRIFVCGLSMGGILSLTFAARFPVAGVVAMSTPYQLPPDPRLQFIRFLQYLQPKVPKGKPDWNDPKVANEHIDYPYYPTRTIQQLMQLIAAFHAELPNISAPVLLIHSRDDQVVAPENVQKIYAAIGSVKKEKFMIENSGHAITCDRRKDLVFQAAYRFIQQQQILQSVDNSKVAT